MCRKILIVDDESHLRLFLEPTLEDLADEADIELLTASNGLEALDVIPDEPPNLVFLDVMMPKMNDFKGCQRVKKELLPGSHIILPTAKGQAFNKVRGQEVGANLYMTKPCDPVVKRSLEVLGC